MLSQLLLLLPAGQEQSPQVMTETPDNLGGSGGLGARTPTLA